MARQLLIEKHPSSKNGILEKGLQGWRPGSPFSFGARWPAAVSARAAPCRPGDRHERSNTPVFLRPPLAKDGQHLAIIAFLRAPLAFPGEDAQHIEPSRLGFAAPASGSRSGRVSWPSLLFLDAPALPQNKRRASVDARRTIFWSRPDCPAAEAPAVPVFGFRPSADRITAGRPPFNPFPRRGVWGPQAPSRRRPPPVLRARVASTKSAQGISQETY